MYNCAKLAWRAEETPAEVAAALRELEFEYPISEGGRGLKLRFVPVPDADTVSRVDRNRGGVTIEYSNLAGALRGVGSALAKLDGGERTPFVGLGIMLDLSRNMVMRPDHLKMWLRRLALCGCSQLQLYCEDVYELEGEPFFGAYRGAYSKEELREIDDYAAALGIEVVGSIQTLGHMEQILKYRTYAGISDTERILLADSPETEALIAKMVAFWAGALRSRRIHVGMDEAHGLGRGRYQTLHGATPESRLMLRHLSKVAEICRESGLAPMIWSDMFFNMTNPEHRYYDYTSPFPPEVKGRIDPAVQLVYWDYYHRDVADYRRMIARHRELGKEPVMASGIWTWSRLWYDHKQTLETVMPCLEVCRQEKVRELFFTMWGDDGAYCDYDSALAGIVRCADLAYGCRDENDTAERFAAICGADYGAVVAASEIQSWITPAQGERVPLAASMLLWDDPLLGIYFDNCRRVDPEFDLKYLDELDDILARIMPFAEEEQAGDMAYAVELVKFLIKKVELRGALEAAYDHGDRLALRELAVTTIPAAAAALTELDAAFRRDWLARAKPQGLERIQVRNAGQLARLEELAVRIREYLDGEIDRIEELDDRPPLSAPYEPMTYYKRVSGGSWLI